MYVQWLILVMTVVLIRMTPKMMQMIEISFCFDGCDDLIMFLVVSPLFFLFSSVCEYPYLDNTGVSEMGISD